jgi:hypothetical protein
MTVAEHFSDCAAVISVESGKARAITVTVVLLMPRASCTDTVKYAVWL